MVQDMENYGESGAGGPSYKSLFVGACIILGSAFGWWFTNFINAVDLLTTRVATLEIRDTEYKWTFKTTGEKINLLEERIRVLEHDSKRDASVDNRKDRQ
jgi:hypothetical protein